MNSRFELKEVSELITKGTTPTTVGCNFTNHGINFIKSESISDSKYLNSYVFEHIDKETDNKLKRSRLAEGDLLFSIAGAYLGKIGIVRSRDLPANTNQAVGIVRLNKKKADVDFLYYYFSQNYINKYINKLSSQSSQPNLNLELLGKLEFGLTDISIQKKIAEVLSSLDSKIELNNNIDSELELMAKTLYNYWFVQFDFPNKNGKPYKTSGGNMIYNNELKKEIPEGWECLFLNDYLEFERGIEPGTANYFDSKETENHIPFYKVGGMDGESKTWILKEIAGSSTAKEDDIFVSFDGTVGKLVIGISGAYSTGIRKIYQKKGYFPKAYVYFIFDSEEVQKTIKKYATGSNILHAGSSIEVLAVPYNKEIVEVFNSKVENIFLKLLQIKKENRELSELRDWLLPMLMNGQITVK